MPQIDFGKAFAEKNAPTKPISGEIGNSPKNTFGDPTDPEAAKPLSIWRTAHFQRTDWANILFVAVAVAGSLFCAFYFYNGSEVLKTAAAWPKEMLYQRPPDPLNDVAIAAATDPFIPRASAVGNSHGSDQGARGNNATPPQFSPSSPANPTNTGAAPSLASLNPGSALPSVPGGNPGGPVPSVPGGPGTENPGQALNTVAANLQRATRLLNGPHTVVILKNHVARAIHRNIAMAEKTAGGGAKGPTSTANSQSQAASGGNVSRLAHNTKTTVAGSADSYRGALTTIGRSSVIGSSRSLGGRDSLGGGMERSVSLSGLGRNAGMSGLGDLAGRGGGIGEGIGHLGRGRGGREGR